MELAFRLPWVNNRRSAQRVPIKLFCAEHLGPRDLQSVATDMSELGLSLRRVGGTRMPAHEAIGLEFALPARQRMIAKNHVHRSVRADDHQPCAIAPAR